MKLKLMLPTLFFASVSSMGFCVAQDWEVITPTNTCTNRHENTMTAVGDKLILLGGRGVKPTEIFDIATHTWKKSVNTPLEMSHLQAVNYHGEVYVMGAMTGNYPHETPIPNIYIYNVEKGEWRVGPEIPKERLRGSAGCVVYKDKIYLVCGIVDGHWDGHVAWLDEYDPQTNTWKKLADAPHTRDHVSVAIVKDKLYVVGGRRSYAKINQVLNLTEGAVDIFDLKKKTWSTLPESLNLPTQRAGNSTIAYGDKIVVIGGESASQVPAHSEVEAFDTKKQAWVKLASLKQGRHGTGMVVVDGKIYVAAGSANRGGGPELNEMEVYKQK